MTDAATILRRAIAAHESVLVELRGALIAIETEVAGATNHEVAAPQVRGQAFLSLKEAAYRLGLTYDAARMRARRAGISIVDGRDALIPARWVDEQLVRKNT
jgi:hypothetical protein